MSFCSMLLSFCISQRPPACPDGVRSNVPHSTVGKSGLIFGCRYGATAIAIASRRLGSALATHNRQHVIQRQNTGSCRRSASFRRRSVASALLSSTGFTTQRHDLTIQFRPSVLNALFRGLYRADPFSNSAPTHNSAFSIEVVSNSHRFHSKSRDLLPAAEKNKKLCFIPAKTATNVTARRELLCPPPGAAPRQDQIWPAESSPSLGCQGRRR